MRDTRSSTKCTSTFKSNDPLKTKRLLFKDFSVSRRPLKRRKLQTDAKAATKRQTLSTSSNSVIRKTHACSNLYFIHFQCQRRSCFLLFDERETRWDVLKSILCNVTVREWLSRLNNNFHFVLISPRAMKLNTQIYWSRFATKAKTKAVKAYIAVAMSFKKVQW